VRALIDLLIEQDGVAVLLVGGTDDFKIAASIMERVDRPDVIGSVAGLTALRDMPRLLAACTLFIGCDSGPKHIAAASGVPTIGIHSGIVDPAEWGPMGERAVALYRDMSCAPCFLAKPEHCPRGLACIELLDPALVWQTARRFLGRTVNDRIAPTRRAVSRSDAVAVGVLPPEEPAVQPDAAEAVIVVPEPAEPAATGSPAPLPAQMLVNGRQSAQRPAKHAASGVANAVAAAKQPAKQSARQTGEPASRMVAGTALKAKQPVRRVQRNPVIGPK
jgi:hypothetical protein